MERHAFDSGHHPFECRQTGCEEAFSKRNELNKHQRVAHVADLEHGYSESSRVCKCGEVFSRPDVLDRHLNGYILEIRKHPCIYCKRHRGEQSFKRKDHLMQHLRGYHHIGNDEKANIHKCEVSQLFCPHASCPQHRGPAYFKLSWWDRQAIAPFGVKSEYTEHMRKIHNESPFPCDITGCSRVEGKGYFREADLIKHRKKEHPESPTYDSSKRSSLLSCQEPNCPDFGKRKFENRLGLYRHYYSYFDGLDGTLVRHSISEEDAYQRAGYPIQSESQDIQPSLGGPSI